jgi:hypothetical protein
MHVRGRSGTQSGLRQIKKFDEKSSFLKLIWTRVGAEAFTSYTPTEDARTGPRCVEGSGGRPCAIAHETVDATRTIRTAQIWCRVFM